MAYIYKITNKLNNKSYIGKTSLSIESRFKEHISDSKKERCEKRPLYSAFNKYGTENFLIEVLEECSSEEASLKEQYWIGRYNTFENGYNATSGGDGKIYKLASKEEVKQVIDKYNSGETCQDIANDLGVDPKTVSRVLKDNNIVIGHEKVRNKYLNSFGLILTNDNEELEFSSKEECMNYLYSLNPDVKLKSISSSINRVLNGSRKTYLGYYITKVE